jgi:hypothetical protein
MYLAGLRIPNEDVFALARLVDEPTRTLLENALERETVIVALTVPDREQIIRALDDPQTDALAELRATLLLEHEWRVREGLV